MRRPIRKVLIRLAGRLRLSHAGTARVSRTSTISRKRAAPGAANRQTSSSSKAGTPLNPAPLAPRLEGVVDRRPTGDFACTRLLCDWLATAFLRSQPSTTVGLERRDVLITAQDVVGVVPSLQRLEAREGFVAKGGAHALDRLVCLHVV
jgi:hypothetical protein